MRIHVTAGRLGGGRRPDRLAVVLAAGYLAALAGLLAARWSPALSAPVAGGSFLLITGAGTVAALRASRLDRLGTRSRRAWRTVAVSFALLAVASVLFIDTGAGFPAAGDLVRLLFVPVLLAALLTFHTRARTPRERWTLFLDAGIVVGASSMLLWYAVVSPGLARHGAGAAAMAAAVAYPVGDLLLIFGAAAALLGGSDPAVRRPLCLLATGLGFQVAGDVYLGYQQSASGRTSLPATWQFACWLTATLLMGLAACAQHWQPGGHSPRPEPVRRIRGVSWLPYLAVGVSCVLLLAAAERDNMFPAGGLMIGAALTTVLVVSRQIVTLRDNQALACTDDLTGLANRTLLYDVLRASLERAHRAGERVAVLVADLDDFKRINDTLGHDAGDRALVAFGEVLRSAARGSDLVARLGGDEFAVILTDVGSLANATAVAQRIADQTAEPVLVGSVTVPVRASIGVALCPAGELDPDEAVRRADVAMYNAKRQQPGGWLAYQDDMAVLDARAPLAAELRAAVDAGQLVLHYQPIVALGSGQLSGLEALVRWQHPTRGLVSPDEFIPLAEQTGLIVAIGTWVLERACRQMLGWQRRAPVRRLYLCVNVSPRQLVEDSFARDVLAVLDRTGYSAHDLVLEVTEGALVQGPVAVRQLEDLHRAGIRVALDDFGTGYSSLRYLTRLPVDILKLDRCFVAELDGTRKGAAVAEAVVRLSHALRLDVVAEGVENREQASELSALGYRSAQGYHYSRPLTAAQAGALIDGCASPVPVRLPDSGGRSGRPPGPPPKSAPDQPSWRPSGERAGMRPAGVTR
jgi:diguanylate cyclase